MRQRPLRALIRRAATCAAAILVAVVSIGAALSDIALAHAELVSSSPAAGSRLEVPPQQITLEFSESVNIGGAPVELFDAAGVIVAIGEARADGSTVTVPTPGLGDGGYIVNWRVVSGDGHPITGAFTFAVGDAAVPAAASDPDQGLDGADVATRVMRGLTYAAFSLVIGLWAVSLLLPSDLRRNGALRPLQFGGAVAALAFSVARIPLEADLLGLTVGDLFDLTSGRAWFALGLLAATLIVVPVVSRRWGSGTLAALVSVFTLAFGAAVAYGGHGASGDRPLAGFALTLLHVAAAAVWTGGLVGLLVVITRHATHAESLARRFSRLAAISVAVLVLTGTLQSLRQLDSMDAFNETGYGNTLLVKLALVAVLLAVAAASRWVVRKVVPFFSSEGVHVLRRTVGVEVMLALAVLVTTGWLAAESPVIAASSAPYAATEESAGASAELAVSPAATGLNVVTVTVTGPTGDVPDEITVRVTPTDGSTGALDVDVIPVSPGVVTTEDGMFPLPGSWTVTVAARFGDFDLVTFEFEVPIR